MYPISCFIIHADMSIESLLSEEPYLGNSPDDKTAQTKEAHPVHSAQQGQESHVEQEDPTPLRSYSTAGNW